MTMRPDGTGFCDKCEKELPNTGIGYALLIAGLGVDGEVHNKHLCTIGPDPCANRILKFLDVTWAVNVGRAE